MNISFVVDNNLCTGCGTCAGICPKSAIQMKIEKGLYMPFIDMNMCQQYKGCDICLQVCPGHSIHIDRLSEEFFPNAKENFYFGRFLSCFIGHSNDCEIRYHSASGGIVSQLLIFMLKNKIIDGAIVTRMNSKKPLLPESIIATTKEEILQARSSKYCPVSLNVLIRDLMKNKGKFAVVGLPCHIHGFRKAEKKFPTLKEKVVLYLGLFCSSSRTFQATKYLLYKYKITSKDVSTFTYRDEGWLGNLLIRGSDGRLLKRDPYLNYYTGLRSFFIPYRCTLCVDHYAELSDISMGDIYTQEFKDDKIGTSSIITRSARGKILLENARVSGEINLQEIDKERIIESQKRMVTRKKNHFVVKKYLMQLILRKFPFYDLKYRHIRWMDKLKYYISSFVLYFEIIIGNKRLYWPLIEKLSYIASIYRKIINRKF